MSMKMILMVGRVWVARWRRQADSAPKEEDMTMDWPKSWRDWERMRWGVQVWATWLGESRSRGGGVRVGMGISSYL